MTKLEIQLLAALRGILGKDGHVARAAVKDAQAQLFEDHHAKLALAFDAKGRP